MSNFGGFSWKRLIGISRVKSKIGRKIGVPLTRSGRQRKLGSAMGCCLFQLIGIIVLVSIVIVVLSLII